MSKSIGIFQKSPVCDVVYRHYTVSAQRGGRNTMYEKEIGTYYAVTHTPLYGQI